MEFEGAPKGEEINASEIINQATVQKLQVDSPSWEAIHCVYKPAS
jgi:hypothetical protein